MSRRSMILAALLVATAACGPSDSRKSETGDASAGQELVRERHKGDWPKILERGYLRVLVESDADQHLPRSGDPVQLERDLAAAFAQHHGIEVRFVPMDAFAALLPALKAGFGDIVAANLTVTPARQKEFAFSVPVGRTHELLVLPASAPSLTADDPITGRVGVRTGTTFEDTAAILASRHEALQVVAYPGSMNAEDMLDSLVTGAVDFVVEDRNRLDVFLDYRDDIQAGPALTVQQPLAWAARRKNPQLVAALDAFLHEEHLLGRADVASVADLPEIKERGRIRMITRNNAATYFLWRGQILGFEYELAREFAEEQGLRLEVIVAPTHDALAPMLFAGEGDFVAAFLTVTDERKAEGIRFSRPYHYASEVVVGKARENPMQSVTALEGRSIAVRRSSSYWSTLQKIRALGTVEFEIVEAPSSMETEAIMAAVADGTYDLTVADSHLLELEMTVRDDLQGLLQITESLPHGWAIHPDNEILAGAIDDFLRRKYRGLFYNVTFQKYFERADQYESGWTDAGAAAHLSPYDDIVRELAAGSSWDWRLVVAQMYQESRFDPKARSWAGARGLMQVLPRTAREMGISNLENPRNGIRAGLEYLAWVWDRFPRDLDPAEHMWFTLAGYNAGHGHVRDARRLARQLGLDPDRWVGNVEVAMLKLSQQQYAQQARHGFVRGHEPVEYVREIRERYRAYVDLLEKETAGR